MRVYIDESGDPGIKLQRQGTSPHFVVAGVIVKDESEHDRCLKGLEAFKLESEIRRAEFKFNQCDNNLRREYLKVAARLPWQYLAVVLNKSKLRSPGFQYKDSLYKYTVNLLLSNAKPYLEEAIVVFDSLGSREFRRTMAPYCKKRSARPDGVETIKRVIAQASHSDQLLQLADMVAGAVARSFKPERVDAGSFRALIRSKELGVQFWPQK